MRETGKRIKILWEKFADKAYRDSFLKSRLRNSVAAQVFFIRDSRGWSQAELAKKVGTQQPAISRIEKGQGAFSIRSLEAIANAFDVGLEIRFVPFSHIAQNVVNGRIEEYVPPFTDDQPEALVSIPEPSALPYARVSAQTRITASGSTLGKLNVTASSQSSNLALVRLQ